MASDRATSTELTKARIEILDKNKRVDDAKTVTVTFNPAEYKLVTDVNYRQQNTAGRTTADPQFAGGKPETLSMTLLFDTYERRLDVREEYTNKLDALLTKSEERHAPPSCRFIWGTFGFVGHLMSADKTFTMFLPDGTPVRASVGISFTGLQLGRDEQKGGGAEETTDQTRTRTVVQGDTLWAISGEEYGDPTEWRRIANANGIEDPKKLRVGTVLVIPPREP
ncbi:peptidoglycan-binding lysin domain-containing protein [Halogeometricum pallidum JCM 14848]|uniref:Peptidoglycan-binding lysin domain-containing protein n=1 Tax=Halogeometricum pallidum JCM 14848 TaxID=1227487 RepID=M0DCK8_HALPD|nr:LysM peptidoglycan-binding domain-containing protein [Halogeometricum pallidum]ELZ32518.1 peptidoglycan-binding lysin domain-containing protein [Halogeometricum pallidum JCM 14848]